MLTTHQRSLLLELNLNSILAQKQSANQKYNLTVGILQNQPDAKSELVIENFKKSCVKNSSIKDVFVIQSQIKLSPPAARDYLIQQFSDYDYYVFIDDDAYFKKNYFSVLNDYITDQKPNLIGGPNYGFLRKNAFQKIQDKFLASFWCGPFRHRYMGYKNQVTSSKNIFILCNLVVSKKVIQPFAKNIKFGEELFLLDQIFKQKYTAHYLKKLVVFHKRRESSEEYLQQIFKYGLGRGEYLASQGNLIKYFSLVSGGVVFLISYGIEKVVRRISVAFFHKKTPWLHFILQNLKHYFAGVVRGLIFTK